MSIDMTPRAEDGSADGATAAPRFESSDFGQAVISAVISLVLIIGVTWNLPDSKIRATLLPLLEPVAQVFGLEQVWKMYAPDVIRQLEYIDIVVFMADGSTRKWVTPSGDKFVGPFDWYHWQKLKENLPRNASLRADVAHWVVRKLTKPSERPLRVQIIFRTADIPPPGQDLPHGTHQEILYDETLAGPK